MVIGANFALSKSQLFPVFISFKSITSYSNQKLDEKTLLHFKKISGIFKRNSNNQ